MPGTIIVVAECQGRDLHPATWDAVALAQRLNPARLIALALGPETAGLAAQFEARVHEFRPVQDPRLAAYSAELHCSILQDAIDDLAPDWIMLPHSYQGRDFAPKLAARYGRSLVADCTGVTSDATGPLFSRPLFQGRLSARVRATGAPPHFITVQPGCCATDVVRLENSPLRVQPITPRFDGAAPKALAEPPQRGAHAGVDLTRAGAIVAVGRGIGSADNLGMIRRLAELLGAEVAASRPVCDEAWLPMERQVGSSGITVSPRLYVAIGISGAIQHLAGMKGAGTIVAINKDANAPIFRIADIGVVGDLHEIVPALIQALESRPGG